MCVCASLGGRFETSVSDLFCIGTKRWNSSSLVAYGEGLGLDVGP